MRLVCVCVCLCAHVCARVCVRLTPQVPLPFYFLKPSQCSDVQNETRKRECNIMPCKVGFWLFCFGFLILFYFACSRPGGFPCAQHRHVSIEKWFSLVGEAGGGHRLSPAHQYSPFLVGLPGVTVTVTVTIPGGSGPGGGGVVWQGRGRADGWWGLLKIMNLCSSRTLRLCVSLCPGVLLCSNAPNTRVFIFLLKLFNFNFFH